MSSPYRVLRLQTKVMLRPTQMDATVYANVKENLRVALLGKCVEAGCIFDIYDMKLLDGEHRAENFSGSADVEVAYSAKVCNPQADQYIACEIVKLAKPIIVAKNGPIVSVVRHERISLKKFRIENDDIINIATGKRLEVGDIVKMRVYRSKFSKSGERIIALCVLEDVATSAEVDMYHVDTGTEKKTSTFVEADEINKDLMTPGADFEELTVPVGTAS
jgi:DNA-directed RNA polymerase subunit E'/Rpb7